MNSDTITIKETVYLDTVDEHSDDLPDVWVRPASEAARFEDAYAEPWADEVRPPGTMLYVCLGTEGEYRAHVEYLQAAMRDGDAHLVATIECSRVRTRYGNGANAMPVRTLHGECVAIEVRRRG